MSTSGPSGPLVMCLGCQNERFIVKCELPLLSWKFSPNENHGWIEREGTGVRTSSGKSQVLL